MRNRLDGDLSRPIEFPCKVDDKKDNADGTKTNPPVKPMDRVETNITCRYSLNDERIYEGDNDVVQIYEASIDDNCLKTSAKSLAYVEKDSTCGDLLDNVRGSSLHDEGISEGDNDVLQVHNAGGGVQVSAKSLDRVEEKRSCGDSRDDDDHSQHSCEADDACGNADGIVKTSAK